MSKEQIASMIAAKKAIMEAEKSSTEKRRGYLVPSFVGGARNDFEALSNIHNRVSGKKYASDTLVSKFGRV